MGDEAKESLGGDIAKELLKKVAEELAKKAAEKAAKKLAGEDEGPPEKPPVPATPEYSVEHNCGYNDPLTIIVPVTKSVDVALWGWPLDTHDANTLAVEGDRLTKEAEKEAEDGAYAAVMAEYKKLKCKSPCIPFLELGKPVTVSTVTHRDYQQYLVLWRYIACTAVSQVTATFECKMPVKP